ncbi:DUF6875 domain-containing protein [Trinickia sp. Y13]|uniref:DUF6875 domain-containing protein n=1 Tax=Trinickia sp. Y13 TaxID=2917807 RepID=UPI002404C725|nr:hypothetical protein [Trinickia sp. Y13]MDG0023458.1 hypothetical protein [Trinickia sp. Y13]
MNEQSLIRPAAEPVSHALAQIERSLCVSTEIDGQPHGPLRSTYATGLAWIRRFIMQPHPNLGRKGAVCPFAKPAHEEQALLFCAFDAADMPFATYIDTLMRLPSIFDRLAKQRREPSDLLSLAIFPLGLRADANYKFIDCTHGILKPFYMECGLMLGEFHPDSTVRGAHSPTFRPMRADVPMFVIRAMALHDILFIDGESTPLGMRVHELECYLRWNAHRLPASEGEFIRSRLAQRKAQLASDEVAAV